MRIRIPGVKYNCRAVFGDRTIQVAITGKRPAKGVVRPAITGVQLKSFPVLRNGGDKVGRFLSAIPKAKCARA